MKKKCRRTPADVGSPQILPAFLVFSWGAVDPVVENAHRAQFCRDYNF